MQNIKHVRTNDLIPYARNARTHSDAQIAQVAASIEEFGFINPVITDGKNGIIAGHCRVLAALKIGLEKVPCLEASHLTETQKRAYILADNKLAENAGWDDELLRIELDDLLSMDFDIALAGFDVDMLDVEIESRESHTGKLSEKFMIPPFTVLNARDSWWQERKNSWLALGIQSEVGRDSELVFSKTALPPAFYTKKNEYEVRLGRSVTWDEFLNAHPDIAPPSTTSIFDPVLCEIVYRWFSGAGAVVIDPFAGGSVRGIVAAKLERSYFGCDLRAEQISANCEQWQAIGGEVAPTWRCGDSRQIDEHFNGVAADLVFSCPPYADLEVYSENPRDLSTMGYQEFLKAYREIIRKSTEMLKDNRFACFVVGEVRGKDGNYYNFVGDTIQAFLDAGLKLYNEAILVTMAASLPIRAGKPFETSRKLGKTHQNVLIFVKGDAKLATQACGPVDVTEALELEQDA